jgi:hypothetical protein
MFLSSFPKMSKNSGPFYQKMTRQDLVKLRQLLGTFLDHIPGLSEIATEYAQEMPYILYRSFQSREWVEED